MRSFSAASSAPPEAAWRLLARPDEWSLWAPHVRGAWGLGAPEVREGAIGEGDELVERVSGDPRPEGVDRHVAGGPRTQDTDGGLEVVGVGLDPRLQVDEPDPR